MVLMRTSGHAVSSFLRQPKRLARYAAVCLPLMCICCLGCGDGEDFSKPPTQIQSQLNKAAKPESGQRQQIDPTAADSNTLDQTRSEGSPSPEGNSEASAGTESAPTGTAAPQVAKSDSSLSMPPPSSPSGREAPAEPPTVASSPPAGDGSEVLTASGKSAEAIAAKKADNSKKSVMGNAGGLLGSLKGSGAKGSGDKPDPVSNPDPDVPAAITRFGRFALSRDQWLQLATQMTRQFFVASTPDGSGIAGSTGERSLEVIDTRLDLRSRAMAPGSRMTQDSASPIHIPVFGLPGIINSLELSNDGQQILVGTTDGRLLVRSAASTADWDLFARDLFLFQDENRRTARLSDTAIVAIRCLPDSRFLTIDANGTCAFWKMTEAVLPVTPILDMTVEQAKAMEAETVSVAPVASFPVSGFQILSIKIDADQNLGAIVTSSEEVYVFRTDTGELSETLKAERFADTQPVCVEFIADGTEILAGLADGRILRRALMGTAPVTGIDDHGDTVDYGVVYVPDVQDHVSSITSIRTIPGSRAIYFGTIDGTVVRFDTASKRIEQTKKRHAAPVIKFLATPHGMLSIGVDRQAQLFDVPVTPQSGGENSEVTFQLPPDETLNEPAADKALAQNAAADTAKSTRPVRRRVPEKPPVDLSLAGIRPGDAALALYNHQLRASANPAKTLELRKQILRHQGANSIAESLGIQPAEVPDGELLRAGELATQMQFSAGNWSRVLLAISDDGATVAAQHRGEPDPSGPQAIARALSLFDMTTRTSLRHWTQHGPARSLHLNLLNHVVVGDPGTTCYWNATGFAEMDPLRPVASSAASTDLKHLFLGSAGRIGIVEPALTRITLSDRSKLTGVELFESRITAMALSGAGDHLYVSTRERDQVRLLDVEPQTLSIQQEIFRHPFNGRIPADSKDVSLALKAGTVLIQPSPSDKLMLTWGFYDGGEKLLLWKRSGAGWPQENMVVINVPGSSPDLESVDAPVTFVNGQDSRIAIMTATGVMILSTRKPEVEKFVPIPAVSGHRPPCVFSPDGRWLLIGDGEGNVWAGSLLSLDRKPIRFSAHTGPIAGLAMSSNGQYLVTIGEDSLLRSWRVDGFLKR